MDKLQVASLAQKLRCQIVPKIVNPEVLQRCVFANFPPGFVRAAIGNRVTLPLDQRTELPANPSIAKSVPRYIGEDEFFMMSPQWPKNFSNLWRDRNDDPSSLLAGCDDLPADPVDFWPAEEALGDALPGIPGESRRQRSGTNDRSLTKSMLGSTPRSRSSRKRFCHQRSRPSYAILPRGWPRRTRLAQNRPAP